MFQDTMTHNSGKSSGWKRRFFGFCRSLFAPHMPLATLQVLNIISYLFRLYCNALCSSGNYTETRIELIVATAVYYLTLPVSIEDAGDIFGVPRSTFGAWTVLLRRLFAQHLVLRLTTWPDNAECHALAHANLSRRPLLSSRCLSHG